MMVWFHFFVDLEYLGIEGPDPFSGPLRLFGMITTVLFIGIAGISAHLKIEKTSGFMNQLVTFFVRGGKLLGIGFCITLVTWLVLDGEGYVVFGILHLLGTALLLTPFLYRIGYFGLFLAALLIVGSCSVHIPNGPIWLAWLGVVPPLFYSIDYTPLIPWLSVFLIGLSLGRFFFPAGYPRYQIITYQDPMVLQRHLACVGRHSLVIYLIHQPLLFVLIGFCFGVFFR